MRMTVAAIGFLITSPVFAADLTGLTEPARVAELRPGVDGVVATVETGLGARVEEGAVLLTIRDSVQRARVELARAAASSARVDGAGVALRQAQGLAARVSAAARRGAAPKWEVTEAANRVETAEAELALAADLAAADARRLELESAILRQHRLAAPFSGVVTAIGVEIGEAASRAESLLTLSDLSALEVSTFVPSADLPRLTVGHVYAARLGQPVDRDVKAELIFVEPRIDPASGTAQAIFRIENDMAAPAGVDVAITLPDLTQ